MNCVLLYDFSKPADENITEVIKDSLFTELLILRAKVVRTKVTSYEWSKRLTVLAEISTGNLQEILRVIYRLNYINSEISAVINRKTKKIKCYYKSFQMLNNLYTSLIVVKSKRRHPLTITDTYNIQ